MFGQNPKLAIEKNDGSLLKVNSIFSTFQGEGPYVGQSCVFIRLSGCNLACTFCDTEFDKYEEQTLANILRLMKLSWHTFIEESNQIESTSMPPLVVLTGGEPFRQNIGKLCTKLLEQNIIIQIETNGTIWRPLPPNVQIVCSPKTVQGKYYKIRPEILKQTIAIKFLVSPYQEGYEDIGDVGQADYDIPVYIQPIDHYNHEKNAASIRLALKLAARYKARISIQLHKVLGIE